MFPLRDIYIYRYLLSGLFRLAGLYNGQRTYVVRKSIMWLVYTTQEPSWKNGHELLLIVTNNYNHWRKLPSVCTVYDEVRRGVYKCSSTILILCCIVGTYVYYNNINLLRRTREYVGNTFLRKPQTRWRLRLCRGLAVLFTRTMELVRVCVFSPLLIYVILRELWNNCVRAEYDYHLQDEFKTVYTQYFISCCEPRIRYINPVA